MAKKTVTSVEYTDDLDGSAAAGTVRFGYEGVDYEIDLSKRNAREFEKALALYVGHARRVRSARRRPSRGGAATGIDLKDVRAWAAANGHKVSARGRVPGNVMDAYRAAH